MSPFVSKSAAVRQPRPATVLRVVRVSRGMSLRQLSRASGISVSVLSLIEIRKRRLSLEEAALLERVFGLTSPDQQAFFRESMGVGVDP
jgi:transcriptional regulator with XRE-family HTH domain